MNLAEPGRAPAGEWPSTLDVAALLADGWCPTPFQEFVLKIHGRCDLACDYCYMYQAADQTWRQQPRSMTAEIIEQTASRIGEHTRTHGLTHIKLIMHGGEPLLAGPEALRRAASLVRAAVGSGVRVDVTLQTNGVRLDTAYLRLFAELGVRVGVSLDGDVFAHNRHRRHADGRGSHAAVTAALERLTSEPFRTLFAGLLCTIDVRNDPLSTYEALQRFDPPAIDLLLPHATWMSPPPGRVGNSSPTPYADWLIAIFDRWYHAPVQETRIRFFEEIMYLLVGGSSAIETIGLSPSSVVVVETDGAIEQSDMLKAAYHGATSTGLHVLRDPFDAALLLPPMAARQIGAKALSEECLNCSLHAVCGGGLYPHRYRAGSGFRNPSVYCPDLFRLISHIRQTMQADISARLASRHEL